MSHAQLVFTNLQNEHLPGSVRKHPSIDPNFPSQISSNAVEAKRPARRDLAIFMSQMTKQFLEQMKNYWCERFFANWLIKRTPNRFPLFFITLLIVFFLSCWRTDWNPFGILASIKIPFPPYTKNLEKLCPAPTRLRKKHEFISEFHASVNTWKQG